MKYAKDIAVAALIFGAAGAVIIDSFVTKDKMKEPVSIMIDCISKGTEFECTDKISRNQGKTWSTVKKYTVKENSLHHSLLMEKVK